MQLGWLSTASFTTEYGIQSDGCGGRGGRGAHDVRDGARDDFQRKPLVEQRRQEAERTLRLVEGNTHYKIFNTTNLLIHSDRLTLEAAWAG